MIQGDTGKWRKRSVPKKVKGKVHAEFLGQLGSCTLQDVQKLLNAAQSAGDDQLFIAACVMICCLPSERPFVAGLYDSPFQALCVCGNDAAGDALLHIAQRAQNARVRLEAIRRLGEIGTKAARQLLHALARDGFASAQGFGTESVSTESVREVTFQSIGKLDKPTADDAKAVMDAVSKDIARGEDSPAFKAGALALSHVIHASQLHDVVNAAATCHDPFMSLRLLAACASLDTGILSREPDLVANCLSQKLQGFREEGDLTERLSTLARKVVSKTLVQKCKDMYGGDCLDRGRGMIIATALEAYPEQDEVLTEAYLRFAQTPENARTGSKCLYGLATCVEEGHAAAVARRIVGSSAAGHQQIVRSGACLSLFGDIRDLVYAFSTALDEIQSPQQCIALARGCCEGLVRSSLLQHSPMPVHTQLEALRSPGRRQGTSAVDVVTEALRKVKRDSDGLAALASRLCSRDASPGAKAIGQLFLSPYDSLAGLFLERIIDASLALRLEEPLIGSDDLPLVEMEQFMLPECSHWLREDLPGRIVRDGKLNRYALDFMRRQNLNFVDNADKAMQNLKNVDDAKFVLRLLAAKADPTSIRLLGRAMENVFSCEGNGTEIRLEAVNLLGGCSNDTLESLNGSLRQELLAILHNRIRVDTKQIRVSAYKACSRFADASSINPLQERLKSERDAHARQAIGAALTAIRQNLIERKPSGPAQQEAIVVWLRHVGDLSDGAMVAQAITFLCPPYPEAVLVAALGCLGKIGDRSTIAAIDAFVDETSPAGDVLKAARLAKATLQGRKDLSFMQILSAVFDSESSVFEPEVAYDVLFGAEILSVMATCLAGALEQWDAHHWGDFVDRIDGLCDLINRDTFQNRYKLIGLTEKKALAYLEKPYGGRMNMDELKKALPTVQPLFTSIHSMRGLTEGPHALKSDGTQRPGISESQAKLVMQQFKELFTSYVGWASKDAQA